MLTGTGSSAGATNWWGQVPLDPVQQSKELLFELLEQKPKVSKICQLVSWTSSSSTELLWRKEATGFEHWQGYYATEILVMDGYRQVTRMLRQLR
jgi:hypothetical protein